MRKRAIALSVAFAGLAAAAADGQRAPVLPQINVPHSYYYREMYLPQVTTGPSAVAWAPDGKDVVVAMQGSLWRHRLGTRSAEQIVFGPGYAYQPDWSPDGRFIAYAWYAHDAIDLRLLDVATGRSIPLIANGAVNVEPRWSPDGRRIAYVSTAFEGRWHINVLDVRDGRPGTNERVTADRESRLPRYYYSGYDHFLSPTWSPDGKELLFISNAGRIWGTGGFWRMEARAGASPHEIRYEETTWKARPDWSRDGRRVVYSSYLGRAWNQLWLMTSDGGDAFPLTYGDFDATAPRWSPDTRRIAYISNEGGNTSLWTIEIPGGRRQRVDLAERRYREPVATLAIAVVDAATGAPMPARISVTADDGRGFAPDDAWRHADDAFDRKERPLDYSYFHTSGRSELTVPAGRIVVEATHGLRFRPARREMTNAPDGRQEVRVSLERLTNLDAEGWRSGDLHVHMNYGGTYRNTPENLLFQAQAEDLDVVENLIVNKEQRIPDEPYFRSAMSRSRTDGPLLAHGQEFHTSIWGHLGLIGLTDHLLVPDYAGYVNTAAASLYPHNPAVIEMAHAQGAIAGYVHPFEDVPDPNDRSVALTSDLPVAAALGAVDYMEIVGFSDHRSSAAVWYRLLNCGFRIAAGAGTDAMANFASLRGPVGLNRVYARTGSDTSHDAWIKAIREGRTFATNGPLLRFSVNGQGPGSEIRLPRGRHTLTIQAEVSSMVPLDRVEIVSNGEVAMTYPLIADRTTMIGRATIPIDRSGWYTLRAAADHAVHPVLDVYLFATTSPVYVIVGGDPIRSASDARYFVAWLDRLDDFVRGHQAWNDAAARDAVVA
jgi:TolB protein